MNQTDAYFAGTVAIVENGAAHGLNSNRGVAAVAVGQTYMVGLAIGEGFATNRSACPIAVDFLAESPRVVDIGHIVHVATGGKEYHTFLLVVVDKVGGGDSLGERLREIIRGDNQAIDTVDRADTAFATAFGVAGDVEEVAPLGTAHGEPGAGAVGVGVQLAAIEGTPVVELVVTNGDTGGGGVGTIVARNRACAPAEEVNPYIGVGNGTGYANIFTFFTIVGQFTVPLVGGEASAVGCIVGVEVAHITSPVGDAAVVATVEILEVAGREVDLAVG